MAWMRWAPYVPVARRRANALREMEKLRKKGKDIQPIQIEGRTIARSFWGKGWCDHLESFSDFANRLPRGRTYVRNGSVCHLDIQPRRIEAIVSGSELYNIRVNVRKLRPANWEFVKRECSGRIGSMLELLQGRLSDQVMSVVTDRKQGLFPQPSEIELDCDCPDWATMCKHVAAVLYGIGSRLDTRPELLFLLRDVDAEELISTEISVPVAAPSGDTIDDNQLGDIFGIDLDDTTEERSVPTAIPKARRGTNKRPTSPKTERKPRSAPRRASASSKRGSTSSVDNAGASRKVRRKTTARKERGRRASVASTRGKDVADATPRSRPTGKSVARLRARLGLSAAEFARQLGVSAASVYRWEATIGRLKLQARPLTALAKLQRQTRGK